MSQAWTIILAQLTNNPSLYKLGWLGLGSWEPGIRTCLNLFEAQNR